MIIIQIAYQFLTLYGLVRYENDKVLVLEYDSRSHSKRNTVEFVSYGCYCEHARLALQSLNL